MIGATAAGRFGPGRRSVVLALAIVVSVGIGLAAGGRLTELARLNIRWWPVVVAGVALQAYSVGHWTGDSAAGVPIRQAAFVVTHGVILAVAVANIGLPGIRTVVLGAAANMAALVVNGGLMPVSAESRVAAGHQAAVDSLASGAIILGSKGVLVPPEQANLWLLTDILVIPRPLPLTAIFSMGDALVAIGLGYLIIRAMRQSPGQEMAVQN